jgi:arginyl-tRNA synthetase
MKISVLSFDDTTINILHETERDIIAILSRFPDIIAEAAENFSPSVLAQYVYEVAKTYNRFYTEVPIFKVEDDYLLAFRIVLSKTTAHVISKGMRLLGIQVPDRM